jgi:protein Mpv17
MIQRVLLAFNRANDHFPIATQSAVAGSVASVGDVLMQWLEQREQPSFHVDGERTLCILSYRALLFAPSYVLWMRLLESRLKGVAAGRAIVTKIALDQFLWTPPSMVAFYMWLGALENAKGGQSLPARLENGALRARELLWPTLMVNWPFWSAVHIATFGFIPVQHRILWVSCVQVGWNAFISGLNEKAKQRNKGAHALDTCNDNKPA